MIIVIELQRAGLSLVSGPVHAVNQKDVLPAVPVIVEEGASGAKRFRQKLASISPAVVAELDSSRISHIGKVES